MATQSTTTEVLDALRRIDSPTVANAVEHFKVRDPIAGYADMRLQCQFPENEPMVGYAITCTETSTTAGDNRPQNLGPLLDAIQAAPKPAVLVIKNIGPDPARSCFIGDMFCSVLQKLGVVGVVTDGGYRDRTGIRKRVPEFQLFSTGLVVSHGHGVFVDIDPTVAICGLTIQSGDILHGDESGLLTVPHEVAESVAERAKEVHAEEREYFEFLDSEDFDLEELKRRLGIH